MSDRLEDAIARVNAIQGHAEPEPDLFAGCLWTLLALAALTFVAALTLVVVT